tara:strand:+ start:2514 stop:3413 length:900 start_codon:yes stop_codon:yes gene_type:complete
MRKSQEEVLNELKLRRLIRKAIEIREAKNKKTKQKRLLEEDKLRKVIRHLIKEGDVDSDTKPAPYASTPVNALADAFNQILPVLKSGLRSLSEPEERMSYRAHVLEKFKSIFGNFEGLDAKQLGAIGESDLTEQEGSIKISLDDDARIMPSDGKEDDRFKEPEKDPEEELEKEFDSFKMAGENPTGARVAFETINDSNIEQVLSDKRKVLYKPEYKEEFKDYAMYNVDLWLLTYEKELADSLGQQPAFEDTVMPKPSGAETKGVASEFEGGGSAPTGPGDDAPVEAEPLADEGELPPPV